MNLRRSWFFHALLLCPFFACAAAAAPPAEAKEPDEWRARLDKESFERERAAAAPALVPLAVPTPLQKFSGAPAFKSGDPVFRQAYVDVFNILSEDNECSRFFGGAAPAAYVFNQFAARVKPRRLAGADTAGMMSGKTRNVTHFPSGLKFRLFEKAVINTDGPFYRRKAAAIGAGMSRVGSFAPDTRGARALILLHELGHLMKDEGGRWLLAEDGREVAQSVRNTELVEENCAEQLKSLGAAARRPAPQVAASPAQEPGARESDER